MTIDFWSRIFIFFIGAALGSFLNVVALRYGTDKKWWLNRSGCPHCSRQLRWWELIPLFSFVFLRARCGTCGATIKMQYIVMEAMMGICAVLIFSSLPLTLSDSVLRVSMLGAVGGLLVLALIDLRTFLLPDAHILILSVLVAVSLFLQPDRWNFYIFWGALVGSGFLLLLWIVTRGQGVGLGDVKLMVPLGALLGLQGVILLFFIAFCVGGLVGIVLLLQGKAAMKTAIPFGPFLAGAAILIILIPTLPAYFFTMLLG